MKRCLSCGNRFSSSSLQCPQCFFEPKSIEGFTAFAPELAFSGGGFQAAYFDDLMKLEVSSFWFRARNKIILWAIEKYRPPSAQRFLEIGCGTGFVLSGISSRFSDLELWGSEIFVNGLKFAASRIESANFIQMDARNIPFENEFDIIGSFDVLEHIDKDLLVLKQINTALKPKGILLLTVPQHKWLWSYLDDYAYHVRRYTANNLHRKITTAGFRIIKSTSFVSTLLPAMILSRFALKKKDNNEIDVSAEFKVRPWINELCYNLLRFELTLINKGICFPLGGSRLVIAEKIGS